MVRFVALPKETPPPSPESHTPTPPPIPLVQPPLDGSPVPDYAKPKSIANTADETATGFDPANSNRRDIQQQIGASVVGVGLLLLSLSPFFSWIKIGAGGVSGIAGDGKIVLGITAVVGVVFAVAIFKGRWLVPTLLSVQAWGSVAIFWMGALIWKVGAILNSHDLKDNPFAALFATQIRPGTGLYLGLIGGITIATSAGFLAFRVLSPQRKLTMLIVTQVVSVAIGLLLAFIVGPDRLSRADQTEAKLPSRLVSVPNRVLYRKSPTEVGAASHRRWHVIRLRCTRFNARGAVIVEFARVSRTSARTSISVDEGIPISLRC